MVINYLDFELEIGAGNGVDFPVAVMQSPAGEARAAMRWPFSQLALENRLKDVQIALLGSGGKRRQALSSEEQAVQTFGSEIFDALITGEVRSRYDVSQERARQQGKGLRLKLHIQAPALAVLPWEFLYDTRAAEYVCLSRNTPIVRYLELPQTIQPLTITPPLRILGMIASPNDLQTLDIAVEKARVERAISDLQTKGAVSLTWLEGQTWRHLQRTIGRSGPWHVFHFIGHGGFDTNRDEGLVALADDQGNAHFFSATELGRLLADHRSLRLVLLNACEGARGSVKDVFSSTAATLVRRGIPAVVAMQYAITDAAAIEFAQTFYENLADAMPVDAAVIEARKAISFSITNSVEWGTPVLYMRSPDGQLFDVDLVGPPALPLPKVIPPPEAKPIAVKSVSAPPQVMREQLVDPPQRVQQQPEPEAQDAVISRAKVLPMPKEETPALVRHPVPDDAANRKTRSLGVPAYKTQTWQRWLIGAIVLVVAGVVIASLVPTLLTAYNNLSSSTPTSYSAATATLMPTPLPTPTASSETQSSPQSVSTDASNNIPSNQDGVTVNGKLHFVDGTGNQLGVPANPELYFKTSNKDGYCEVYSVTLDQNGSFVKTLPAGNYIMTVLSSSDLISASVVTTEKQTILLDLQSDKTETFEGFVIVEPLVVSCNQQDGECKLQKLFAQSSSRSDISQAIVDTYNCTAKDIIQSMRN